MASGYTAQYADVAWVNGFDDIRCEEASTASKSVWLKSLHLGCLNKSVNEKLQVYSHLRSLSSKMFQNNEARERNPVLSSVASQAPAEGVMRPETEAEEVSDQELSMVILEDQSRPPQAMEEVTPLMFTPTAFFHYLKSSIWGGPISVRVVNGRVRDLILAALYNLETNFRVDSKVLYANLNNRFHSGLKETSHKLAYEQGMVTKEHVKKALEGLPKPHEPKKEFVYEKINVEIVFYEKSVPSNIPYFLPKESGSDISDLQPMERSLLRTPYALKQHRMNYLRLPASEDTDIKKTIQQLENELTELKSAESMPKDTPVQAPLSEKMFPVQDKIDWIADDPYLVPENVWDIHLRDNAGTRGGKNIPVKSKTSPQKPSRAVSETVSTLTPTVEGILIETKSDLAKHLSQHEVEDEAEDGEEAFVPFAISSEGSYMIITSPTEFMKEEEDAYFKKLNLTRNELYVAGLYNPRKENVVSLKERLDQAKQSRLKRRLDIENSVFERLKNKLSFDLTNRFKCLKTATGAVFKKTAPDMTTKATKSSMSLSAPTSSWDEYQKDQEDMEMDSALINDVERGILNRILTYRDHRGEFEQEAKVKGIRNRNKSNTSQSIISLTRLKTGESVYENQQRSYNCNIGLASETNPRNENAKNKLPLIHKKERHRNLNEHNSKCSFKLPPLTTNNNERINIVRYKQDEVSGIEDKTNICDLKTGKLLKKSRVENIHGNKSNNLLSKFQKDCKHGNIEKVAFQHVVSYRKLLPVRKNKNNSNRQTNQNCSGNREQEEAEDISFAEDVEELGDGDVVNDTHDNVGSRETLHDTHVEEAVSVDSYVQKLQMYQCDCSCEECVCLTGTLCREKGSTCDTSYPLFLGQLRRDFKFMKYLTYEPQALPSCAETLFRIPEVTHQSVCDTLLQLMETTTIRKELLTSSLGGHYLTITFTRPAARKQLSHVL